jgi:hypothetical protein
MMLSGEGYLNRSREKLDVFEVARSWTAQIVDFEFWIFVLVSNFMLRISNLTLEGTVR